MKTLPAQELAQRDYAQLLARVDAILWELVYKPVVEIVRPTLPRVLKGELSPRDLQEATAAELRNAGEAALKRALQDGGVQMAADRKTGTVLFFVAKPDRKISDGLRDIGAKLDRRAGTWSMPQEALPAWVRAESESYGVRAREAHERVKRLLDDIEGRIGGAVDEANLAKAADHAIGEVAKGWAESAKTLQTSWDLGEVGRQALTEGFEKSARIPIKNWAKEAIGRLRQEVDENASRGYRAEGLAERIRNEYGVSKGRADLIARQETSNFMADYRKARALDAGLHEYVWWCVMDSKTRPDHKKLHKTTQRYDAPPIVATQPEIRRANPGQDFRCRCNDLPKLK